MHPVTTTIELELRPAADHRPGRTELDLVYDGARPPEAFFDAARAAGWRRPVNTPPPRDAVDWNVPDPERGTRHTVRSFRAVARLIPEDPSSVDTAVQRLVETARAYGVAVDERFDQVAPTAVLVSCTVAPADVDTTRRAADGADVVAEQPVTLVRSTTYRGRTTDTPIEAIRLILRVPVAELDSVMSALSTVRVLEAARVDGPVRSTGRSDSLW